MFSCMRRASAQARPAVSDIVRRVADALEVSGDDLEFVIDVANAALIGIVTEWIAGGMKEEYKDSLDRLFLSLDAMVSISLASMRDGKD